MITPDKINSDGKVVVHDNAPEKDENGILKLFHLMWPIDAAHALKVEPDRYSLEPPEVIESKNWTDEDEAAKKAADERKQAPE